MQTIQALELKIVLCEVYRATYIMKTLVHQQRIQNCRWCEDICDLPRESIGTRSVSWTVVPAVWMFGCAQPLVVLKLRQTVVPYQLYVARQENEFLSDHHECLIWQGHQYCTCLKIWAEISSQSDILAKYNVENHSPLSAWPGTVNGIPCASPRRANCVMGPKEVVGFI